MVTTNERSKKFFVNTIFLVLILSLMWILFNSMNQSKAWPSSMSINQFIGNKQQAQEASNCLQIEKTYEELKSLFDEVVFNVSEIQKLVPQDVLIKTLKFSLQEVDEYDDEYVEFVRGLIKAPAKGKPLNLTIKNKSDFSQVGQSKFIDELLKSKRNGFFIEAGAHDGEHVSNTLFFEIERGWTGLLIEPVPSNYVNIFSKNRNAYAINACIAERKPMVAKFRVANALSGIEREMSEQHKKRIDMETNSKNANNEQVSYIPCFSLNTIMRALGVSKVDYFSLDVEGAEWPIIRSIDYARLDITSLSIEYAVSPNTKDFISKHLINNSHYKLVKDDSQDFYFLKL